MNKPDINIAQEIYKEVGSVNKYTINEKHSALVDQIVDKKVFLIYNFQNYDSKYCIGLMLTFPILWNTLTNNDWIYILKQNSPRKKRGLEDYRLINDDGQFSDLMFLSSYFNVNIIDLISILKRQIDSVEYKYCLEFVKKFTFKFDINENELIEDLNDFYNITKTELKNYSDQLFNGGFSLKKSSENELYENAVKLLSRINLD